MDNLKQQELFISKHCLKSDSSLDYKGKQDEFYSTCNAIHSIIQEKIFRIKYQSVEIYFRTRWDISRAQAYRFMDSFQVLQSLKHLPTRPHRIRLCQALKKYAGQNNRQALINAWEAVVKECGDNEEAVSAFDWNRMPKPSALQMQPARLVSTSTASLSSGMDEDSDETMAGSYLPNKVSTSSSSSRRRLAAAAYRSSLSTKKSKGPSQKPTSSSSFTYSPEIELAHILTQLSGSSLDSRSSWALSANSDEMPDYVFC